ncbi:MAG: hypothetical protein ABI723_20740 [Bacteroidia bacterium]
MINKSNYESWFLDYHEGTLPAEQVAELFLFLEQHPELLEEFDAFENIKLTDDLTDVFPNKAFLKKAEINADNVQQFLIAELEGDLTADEQKALNDFIAANKQFEKDKLLYSKTKLGDEAEVFPGKELLKKIPEETVTAQPLLIAELEGDINPAEQKRLNTIVAANPELERDRTLYSKAKLVADASIKYPNKGELKKAISMFGNRNLIYTISIAASILLFLGIYFYSSQEINPAGNNSVAVVNDKNNSGNHPAKENQKSNDSVNQNSVQSTIHGDEIKTPALKSYTEEKKNPNKNQEQQVANDVKKKHEKKGQQEQIQNNQNTPEQNVAQQQNPQPKQEPVNNLPQQVPVVQNPVAQNNTPDNQNTVAPKTSTENNNPSMALSQPVTVKEAASQFANEKLARLTGNDDFMDPGKKKNKKLDMLTWAVNKIGGKKVKIQTTYDADDKVADVNVTGSGFSIEHVKGF